MRKLDFISLLFLVMVFYKQVRNMVGTLLKIGNGRMPVSQVKTVLESRDRNLAGPTAKRKWVIFEGDKI